MFKKILIIGICLVALNVKAEELPIFTIGSSTAYKDETITVPIKLGMILVNWSMLVLI